MSGFQYNAIDNVVRSNLWSTQLKEVLLDDLFAMGYVDMITDFPDGDTMNIVSVGQQEVYDYGEGQAIRYTAMDTGNFTFSITDYKASATFITNRMKQDSYLMSQIVSSFVPKQNRAIMKSMEGAILGLGPNAQTLASTNPINGAEHRLIGSGTANTMSVNDFARALYALQKANVPATNLVAIVDPSVEYAINTITNISNISNNPQWEGIVSTGISSGMKFVKNIYGFDVYTSQNLKTNTASENIVSAGPVGSKTTAAGAVNNLFFSAASDVVPFIGSLRQPPVVDSGYNKELQRDEYVTTCRYGFKLYRPENMVCVVTDVTQV